MSSADSSPGRYLGSLEAGKIASSEIGPTIRNDARNARSLASSLIATAFSTCSGVAEAAASTLPSSLLVTKSAPPETARPEGAHRPAPLDGFL
jgi:hypothetical protein